MDHFAKLLPVKIGNQGSSAPESWYLAGLDYLVANPTFADVVNFSISNFLETSFSTNALNALAETAILIAAAGNGSQPFGADTGHPESHPAVLTVAATDRFDQIWSSSDGGNSVELAAPGVDIVAASFSEPFNASAFDIVLGTSYAAPIVAGIASLGLSLNPDLTRYELEVALRESSIDLGAPGKDTVFGWGRVNARQALIVLDSILFADGFEGGNTSAWTTSFP